MGPAPAPEPVMASSIVAPMVSPGDQPRPAGSPPPPPPPPRYRVPPAGPPVAPPIPGPFPPPTGFDGPPAGRTPGLLDPSVPPRTRGDAAMWFLFALIGFVAGQLVGLVFTMVAAAVAGKGNQLTQIANLAEPPEWYVASSLLGLWVGFFLGPWLASRVRGTRRFVADLGLRFTLFDLLGIAIGFGGQVLVGVMYAPFVHHIKHFNAPTQKLTGASHGGGLVLIAVLTVVGAPFFEELFFRGLVLRALTRLLTPSSVASSTYRTLGIIGAIAVDGLLFGLAHGELVQLAGLAAFGMILAFVAYRTRRLGMSLIAHATFNFIAILSVVNGQSAIFH